MGGDFSQKNVDCSKGIYAMTGTPKHSISKLAISNNNKKLNSIFHLVQYLVTKSNYIMKHHHIYIGSISM